MDQLKRMDEENIAWMDVRREVMDRYNEGLQSDIDAVEVWHANCNTYYRVPSGRGVTQWPHTMDAFRDRVARAEPEAFEVRLSA